MSATALATSVASEHDTIPTPYKLVTHQRPDTDAWACLWVAARFIAKDVEYSIHFVPAGDRLPPEEEEGYRVIYMDTGKGHFDQHEKELARTSSCKLLCEGRLLYNDPALKPIIELTVATDNVEAVDRTSVHYVLKGLAYHYKDPETKEIDWSAAQVAAFVIFDILYSQAVDRERNRSLYEANKEGRTLANGIKIANLWHRPGTRDAAFEDGCDVVAYFVKRRHGIYPIIQVNRNSKVLLDRVIFGLRTAEAKKRGVPTKGHDLWAIGSNPAFGAWFYHDSRRMIACGTNGHELTDKSEFTQLSVREIMNVIYNELTSLPAQN
jgi:hypothetical protein